MSQDIINLDAMFDDSDLEDYEEPELRIDCGDEDELMSATVTEQGFDFMQLSLGDSSAYVNELLGVPVVDNQPPGSPMGFVKGTEDEFDELEKLTAQICSDVYSHGHRSLPKSYLDEQIAMEKNNNLEENEPKPGSLSEGLLSIAQPNQVDEEQLKQSVAQEKLEELTMRIGNSYHRATQKRQTILIDIAPMPITRRRSTSTKTVKSPTTPTVPKLASKVTPKKPKKAPLFAKYTKMFDPRR